MPKPFQASNSNSLAAASGAAASPNLAARLKQWQGRLKINQKIGWGYGIALGIATIGITAGIIIGEHYQQRAWERKEHAHRQSELLHRLHTEILQARKHQQQFTLLAITQPTSLETEYSQFIQRVATTKQAWAEIRYFVVQANTIHSAHTDMGHAQKIPQFLLDYEKISVDHFRNVTMLMAQIEPSQSNSPVQMAAVQQQLLDFAHGPLAIEFDQISNQLAHLAATAQQDDEIAEAALVQAEAIRLWIVAGSMMLSIAIATLLAFLTSIAIAHPIQIVTAVARHVTLEENFDLQAAIATDDEIGSLADSLNRLIRRVKQLNEQLKAENIRIKAELDVARAMQQMILPKPNELNTIEDLDIAAYMAPADEVGGDYYDVLDYDGAITLGIGDVTGHGLESGMALK